jgi:hypothetical protein
MSSHHFASLFSFALFLSLSLCATASALTMKEWLSMREELGQLHRETQTKLRQSRNKWFAEEKRRKQEAWEKIQQEKSTAGSRAEIKALDEQLKAEKKRIADEIKAVRHKEAEAIKAEREVRKRQIHDKYGYVPKK